MVHAKPSPSGALSELLVEEKELEAHLKSGALSTLHVAFSREAGALPKRCFGLTRSQAGSQQPRC